MRRNERLNLGSQDWSLRQDAALRLVRVPPILSRGQPRALHRPPRPIADEPRPGVARPSPSKSNLSLLLDRAQLEVGAEGRRHHHQRPAVERREANHDRGVGDPRVAQVSLGQVQRLADRQQPAEIGDEEERTTEPLAHKSEAYASRRGTWQAFGTVKPVAGLYVDETPQIIIYRPR